MAIHEGRAALGRCGRWTDSIGRTHRRDAGPCTRRNNPVCSNPAKTWSACLLEEWPPAHATKTAQGPRKRARVQASTIVRTKSSGASGPGYRGGQGGGRYSLAKTRGGAILSTPRGFSYVIAQSKGKYTAKGAVFFFFSTGLGQAGPPRGGFRGEIPSGRR